MANFSAPTEEIVLAHFVVSRNVEPSRRVYTAVLGGETVIEGEPSIVAPGERVHQRQRRTDGRQADADAGRRPSFHTSAAGSAGNAGEHAELVALRW